MLTDTGIILISTLLQPGDIDSQGLAWWYAAPRNAHVSLYSSASLRNARSRGGLPGPFARPELSRVVRQNQSLNPLRLALISSMFRHRDRSRTMAVMPQNLDLSLSFHSLYKSPLVACADYHCHACRGGPGAEELAIATTSSCCATARSASTSAGAASRPTSIRPSTSRKGSSYRVSHPADCGDRGTTFAVATRVLQRHHSRA